MDRRHHRRRAHGDQELNQPLDIAIVCYPSLGGSGVIATALAAGLAERGHRVHVIANAPPRRTMPRIDGLVFHEVAAADYPLFDHPPYAIALAAALVEVHQRHHLDIVNVHYAIPHAASAYLARQAIGNDPPRVVTTLHGTDVTRLGADPRYRSITRFTVAASDAITVPSAYLRGEAYRCLGLPPAMPIEIIPNFVDTDVFTPAAQRDRSCFASLFPTATAGPVLIHVSNFRPVKRTADLIDVLALVRRTVPARLVLIGDGPERAAAGARAEALGLARDVCFLGQHPLRQAQGERNFIDLVRHADAFLLTSESESFGVAALEALSCGVPVCGYRVGGLPEVVTAAVGRLVDPLDRDALACAVVDLLDDPAQRDRLGTAARAHARARFDRAPALDRYEAYFRGVAARPTRNDEP